MELGWLQSILFGLLSGIIEILPVSARAHSILLMRLFGVDSFNHLSLLFIRLAILIGIYTSYQKEIVRVSRAINLASIPKKRRKRPLDIKSLKDFALWRRMVLPVILVFLFYGKISALESNQMTLAALMFVNGVLLYVPQFFPTGNKDSRTISTGEGIAMGIGGASAVLPGISGTGVALSIASVCGVERKYALSLVMLMNMAVNFCFGVYEGIAIAMSGLGTLSLVILLRFLVMALAAFLGTYLGIKIMKFLAHSAGYTLFAFYSWGISLFIFIINLIA